MGDDALAEFLGQYVTWALEVYLQTKQGSRPWRRSTRSAATASRVPSAWRSGLAAPAPAGPGRSSGRDDVAALRRELDEIKKSLKKKPR